MKKILGYLLAGSALFMLTFCKDKDEDKTPEPIIPKKEMLAGQNFKSYKLTIVSGAGFPNAIDLVFNSCEKAYIYQFYADGRFFQLEGSTECAAGKNDTIIKDQWKFNKTEDSIFMGNKGGKLKSISSSNFTVTAKDTSAFDFGDIDGTFTVQ